MIVAIGPDSVTLLEPDDFTRFHVTVTGLDRAAADALLRRQDAGSVADDALVAVSALRAWSGRAGDADWNAGFSRMLGYAGSKGWLSSDGSQIQAHIED